MVLLLTDWLAAHWDWVLYWVLAGTVSAGFFQTQNWSSLLLTVVTWPLIWVYAVTRAIFG